MITTALKNGLRTTNHTVEEEQGELKTEALDVHDFVSRNFTTDQGKPFLFAKREYWIPIYDYQWSMLVIMSSRQAEKSSYIAKRIFYELQNKDNDELLYATASSFHLKIFARSKIDKMFEHRPHLKSRYFDKYSINNLHEKRCVNGSTLLLRAIGNNPESGRSATARKVYFDETQSIDSDSIPVIMEITQSYENSEYAFLGTPLTPQNTLSTRYDKSCQYEWIITCTHCGRENPKLGKEHIDPKKPYLFCIYCGKKMNPVLGRWVKHNESGKYPGFRICRLMTPTCTWRTKAQDGVLDKLDGPDAYPEYMFVNEVLGLPEGVGIQPITEEELRKNCVGVADDYEWVDVLRPPGWLASTVVVGTIDWAWSTTEGGQSYTIYALWVRHGSRIKCIYAKRQVGPKYADPDFSLDDMIRAFINCNVSVIGTDFGIGHKENIRLRSKLKSRKIGIFEFLYAGNSHIAQWDAKNKRYHVGKHESLDYVFSDLSRGNYMFPRWTLSRPYLQDILNVYSEYDPNTKRHKYEHAGTGPDDFLHLSNYARMVFQKM